MKIIGILLIIFGVVDLIGSYTDFDLWGTIGIRLPDLLWQYSSFIEIGLGFFLTSLGSSDDDTE